MGMLSWMLHFFHSQLFVTLPKPTRDFTGETIIVTGSNTGLGFEAARHLSRCNATLVILAVRNLTKGEVAKKAILESTNRKPESIEVWELDLQSFDSIKSFVIKANQLSRLDGILENAGIMTKYFKLVEGFESTITTNVISTVLLALLLVPKFRESASKFNVQPRISIVTSDLHFLAKFPERDSVNIFNALNNEKSSMASMERYAVSKLLEVFVVRELGSIMSGCGTKTPSIIVNCMTPGACKSDFDRESTGFAKFIGNVMAALIARSTEEGSRTLLAGISASEESNGQYMEDCHVYPPSQFVLSVEGQGVQKKVWAELSQYMEAIQPGIMTEVVA